MAATGEPFRTFEIFLDSGGGDCALDLDPLLNELTAALNALTAALDDDGGVVEAAVRALDPPEERGAVVRQTAAAPWRRHAAVQLFVERPQARFQLDDDVARRRSRRRAGYVVGGGGGLHRGAHEVVDAAEYGTALRARLGAAGEACEHEQQRRVQLRGVALETAAPIVVPQQSGVAINPDLQRDTTGRGLLKIIHIYLLE